MSQQYQNKRIIVWSSVCFLWFIITPFAAYYLYIFYIHRNHMELKKRHYETVLCGAVFCGIFWALERSLGLIWSSQIWGESKNLTIIHYIIFPFTIYGLLWSFIWRYWLIFYQVKLASATYSNNKWKSIINKNNDQIDWYLMNQKKYGNVEWTFIRFSCIFLIFFIISSIIQILPSFNVYQQTIGVLLDGFLNLLSFSILLTIWFRTPRFEDQFFIRDELRYIIFAYVALYFCYFIGTGVNSLINGDYFLLTVFQTYSAVIFTVIWFYLSTRWILRKFSLDTRKHTFYSQNNERGKIDEDDPSQNRVITVIDVKKQYSESALNLQLYQLLATNDGFSSFMNHLIYEFSHECLLSFIEMVEWKKSLHRELIKIDNDGLDIINDGDNEENMIYDEEDDVLNLTHDKMKTHSMDLPKISTKFKPKLFQKYSNSLDSKSITVTTTRKNNKMYENNDKILLFEFPSIVPISSIVNDIISDMNEEEEKQNNLLLLDSLNDEEKLVYHYKIKAFKLYKKYVIGGSDLEININSKQRKKLDGFMENMDDWIEYDVDTEELLDLYNHCILEMYRLMQDSFNRFKSTERFLRLDQAKIFEKGGPFQFAS